MSGWTLRTYLWPVLCFVGVLSVCYGNAKWPDIPKPSRRDGSSTSIPLATHYVKCFLHAPLTEIFVRTGLESNS